MLQVRVVVSAGLEAPDCPTRFSSCSNAPRPAAKEVTIREQYSSRIGVHYLSLMLQEFRVRSEWIFRTEVVGVEFTL